MATEETLSTNSKTENGVVHNIIHRSQKCGLTFPKVGLKGYYRNQNQIGTQEG